MTAPATTAAPVGWTDARARRSWTFITLLAAAALVALAAMMMPWMSLSVGTTADPCVIPNGTTSSSVSVYGPDNQATKVTAGGCISAYQSVHLDSFTGTSTEAVQAPFGAPQAGVKYGLPATTFWLVAAALLGCVALVMRNALIMLPALVMLKSANAAFGVQRKALSWGLERFAHEMYGVRIHQYALIGVALGLVCGAVFLIKVNAEQRKLAMAEFKDGTRTSPPALITAQLVATYMLRGNLEKMSEAASAAKEAAKAH